jgi:hypothetical protein
MIKLSKLRENWKEKKMEKIPDYYKQLNVPETQVIIS